MKLVFCLFTFNIINIPFQDGATYNPKLQYSPEQCDLNASKSISFLFRYSVSEKLAGTVWPSNNTFNTIKHQLNELHNEVIYYGLIYSTDCTEERSCHHPET